MVKLESVVADGGEIIVYSPQITQASVTYGHFIEKIGYHVRDYFVKQWDMFKDYPGNVLAQPCNVKGLGTFENGIEIVVEGSYSPEGRFEATTLMPKCH